MLSFSKLATQRHRRTSSASSTMSDLSEASASSSSSDLSEASTVTDYCAWPCDSRNLSNQAQDAAVCDLYSEARSRHMSRTGVSKPRRAWRCCVTCDGLFNVNQTAAAAQYTADLTQRVHGSSVPIGLCDDCFGLSEESFDTVYDNRTAQYLGLSKEGLIDTISTRVGGVALCREASRVSVHAPRPRNAAGRRLVTV